MSSLQMFTLGFHLISVVLWIGGTVFLHAVFLPVVKRTPLTSETGRMLTDVGRRFRRISWIALALLILTGILNLLYQKTAAGYPFSTGYLHLLGGKVLLVVAMIVLHTLALSKLKAATANSGRISSEEMAGLLRRAIMLLAIHSTLFVVVLMMGLMLARV